jgi:hypothetical protein
MFVLSGGAVSRISSVASNLCEEVDEGHDAVRVGLVFA